MAKKFRNRQVSTEVAGEATYVREEYDDAAPEVAVVVEKPKVEVPKLEFDGWWALRSAAIPAIHKKEIIKADFKGRKVSMVSTIAEFDEALKKYGVKLA